MLKIFFPYDKSISYENCHKGEFPALLQGVVATIQVWQDNWQIWQTLWQFQKTRGGSNQGSNHGVEKYNNRDNARQLVFATENSLVNGQGISRWRVLFSQEVKCMVIIFVQYVCTPCCVWKSKLIYEDTRDSAFFRQGIYFWPSAYKEW